MNYRYLWSLVFWALSCGSEESSEMPGMTAEEHAAMTASEPMQMADTASVMREAVMLSTDQERALGVTYITVGFANLTKTIRTVGRIVVPETHVVDVTPKVDGFVETLFVGTTGETVRRGQPLLALYSPMMVAAQEELLTVLRLADRVDTAAVGAWENANAVVAAARRRLEYWDITADQITHIERTGTITKALTLVAPFSGIVLEKHVVQGQHIRSGTHLYRIADLSTVWVEGDVFEQDLQFVREGLQAHIEVSAYPGEHIMGQVSFVYPIVDEQSRTNRVRVTVPNDPLRLKPGMFATVYFDAEVGRDVVAVPLDAVVVTGERNLVFVQNSEGMLTPREVVLGTRAGELVQILSGLEVGEVVVGSANFLVDAESRLGGVGGTMPGMQHAGHGAAIEPDTTTQTHNHD